MDENDRGWVNWKVGGGPRSPELLRAGGFDLCSRPWCATNSAYHYIMSKVIRAEAKETGMSAHLYFFS